MNEWLFVMTREVVRYVDAPRARRDREKGQTKRRPMNIVLAELFGLLPLSIALWWERMHRPKIIKPKRPRGMAGNVGSGRIAGDVREEREKPEPFLGDGDVRFAP
ncbi:MAG: YqzE family protein [Hydrogenibacillus sp.]|nr:YqzE family protein [Hydrogenibacillus sp.]